MYDLHWGVHLPKQKHRSTLHSLQSLALTLTTTTSASLPKTNTHVLQEQAETLVQATSGHGLTIIGSRALASLVSVVATVAVVVRLVSPMILVAFRVATWLCVSSLSATNERVWVRKLGWVRFGIWNRIWIRFF